jgi:hypothetical protein
MNSKPEQKRYLVVRRAGTEIRKGTQALIDQLRDAGNEVLVQFVDDVPVGMEIHGVYMDELNDINQAAAVIARRDDLSDQEKWERFFNLPEGALVKTDSASYRYKPTLSLPREVKS